MSRLIRFAFLLSLAHLTLVTAENWRDGLEAGSNGKWEPVIESAKDFLQRNKMQRTLKEEQAALKEIEATETDEPEVKSVRSREDDSRFLRFGIRSPFKSNANSNRKLYKQVKQDKISKQKEMGSKKKNSQSSSLRFIQNRTVPTVIAKKLNPSNSDKKYSRADWSLAAPQNAWTPTNENPVRYQNVHFHRKQEDEDIDRIDDSDPMVSKSSKKIAILHIPPRGRSIKLSKALGSMEKRSDDALTGFETETPFLYIPHTNKKIPLSNLSNPHVTELLNIDRQDSWPANLMLRPLRNIMNFMNPTTKRSQGRRSPHNKRQAQFIPLNQLSLNNLPAGRFFIEFGPPKGEDVVEAPALPADQLVSGTDQLPLEGSDALPLESTDTESVTVQSIDENIAAFQDTFPPNQNSLNLSSASSNGNSGKDIASGNQETQSRNQGSQSGNQGLRSSTRIKIFDRTPSVTEGGFKVINNFVSSNNDNSGKQLDNSQSATEETTTNAPLFTLPSFRLFNPFRNFFSRNTTPAPQSVFLRSQTIAPTRGPRAQTTSSPFNIFNWLRRPTRQATTDKRHTVEDNGASSPIAAGLRLIGSPFGISAQIRNKRVEKDEKSEYIPNKHSLEYHHKPQYINQIVHDHNNHQHIGHDHHKHHHIVQDPYNHHHSGHDNHNHHHIGHDHHKHNPHYSIVHHEIYHTSPNSPKIISQYPEAVSTGDFYQTVPVSQSQEGRLPDDFFQTRLAELTEKLAPKMQSIPKDYSSYSIIPGQNEVEQQRVYVNYLDHHYQNHQPSQASPTSVPYITGRVGDADEADIFERRFDQMIDEFDSDMMTADTTAVESYVPAPFTIKNLLEKGGAASYSKAVEEKAPNSPFTRDGKHFDQLGSGGVSSNVKNSHTHLSISNKISETLKQTLIRLNNNKNSLTQNQTKNTLAKKALPKVENKNSNTNTRKIYNRDYLSSNISKVIDDDENKVIIEAIPLDETYEEFHHESFFRTESNKKYKFDDKNQLNSAEDEQPSQQPKLKTTQKSTFTQDLTHAKPDQAGSVKSKILVTTTPSTYTTQKPHFTEGEIVFTRSEALTKNSAATTMIPRLSRIDSYTTRRPRLDFRSMTRNEVFIPGFHNRTNLVKSTTASPKEATTTSKPRNRYSSMFYIQRPTRIPRFDKVRISQSAEISQAKQVLRSITKNFTSTNEVDTNEKGVKTNEKEVKTNEKEVKTNEKEIITETRNEEPNLNENIAIDDEVEEYSDDFSKETMAESEQNPIFKIPVTPHPYRKPTVVKKRKKSERRDEVETDSTGQLKESATKKSGNNVSRRGALMRKRLQALNKIGRRNYSKRKERMQVNDEDKPTDLQVSSSENKEIVVKHDVGDQKHGNIASRLKSKLKGPRNRLRTKKPDIHEEDHTESITRDPFPIIHDTNINIDMQDKFQGRSFSESEKETYHESQPIFTQFNDMKETLKQFKKMTPLSLSKNIKRSILYNDMKPPSLQFEDMKPTSLQYKNMKPPTLQLEDMKPPSLQLEDMKPTSLQLEDMKPISLQYKNMKPPTLQLEDMKPTSLQFKSLKPTSLQYKIMKPTSLHFRDTKPNFRPNFSISESNQEINTSEETPAEIIDYEADKKVEAIPIFREGNKSNNGGSSTKITNWFETLDWDPAKIR